MKIQFAEISTQGSRYALPDAVWFPEQDLKRRADSEAAALLTRKSETKVALYGYLRTAVELTCDRCRGSYLQEVDSEMHLVLEFRGAESWRLRELEYRIDDLDLIELERPEIDLGDIFRQQLYLSLPHKWLCSVECRGLCQRCGADLNDGECGCSKEVRNTPFAVLACLKK